LRYDLPAQCCRHQARRQPAACAAAGATQHRLPALLSKGTMHLFIHHDYSIILTPSIPPPPPMFAVAVLHAMIRYVCRHAALPAMFARAAFVVTPFHHAHVCRAMPRCYASASAARALCVNGAPHDTAMLR